MSIVQLQAGIRVSVNFAGIHVTFKEKSDKTLVQILKLTSNYAN